MAALTWFLTDVSVGPGSDLSETDPGAEANRSPLTGWTVSTVGAGSTSAYANDVKRLTGTFVAALTHPDGSLDGALGDWWVSPAPITGSFDAGNWNVHFAARASVAGATQDVRIRCRLFRGTNIDGTGATEITAAQQVGTDIVNLLTTVTQVSTVTFDPGAFSVTNEHIFIQIGCEKTTADIAANQDVVARIGHASGAGSRVVTPNFTATVASGDGGIVERRRRRMAA